MSIQTQLESIIQPLQLALADAKKFDEGMDEPGTRVRKVLFDAREACSELRLEVLRVRGERGKGGQKEKRVIDAEAVTPIADMRRKK